MMSLVKEAANNLIGVYRVNTSIFVYTGPTNVSKHLLDREDFCVNFDGLVNLIKEDVYKIVAPYVIESEKEFVNRIQRQQHFKYDLATHIKGSKQQLLRYFTRHILSRKSFSSAKNLDKKLFKGIQEKSLIEVEKRVSGGLKNFELTLTLLRKNYYLHYVTINGKDRARAADYPAPYTDNVIRLIYDIKNDTAF